MKKTVMILALAAIVLSGCKKDTWIDWRIENQLWLEKIAKEDGVITTPTGLRYKVINQPKTTALYPDDLKSVKVLYQGELINGNIFDSKLDKATILSVSSVISGFAEGLKKMTSGSHYKLYIPYDLGYGEDGHGAEGSIHYIPPYSTLIFDVTLISVE